GLVFPRVAGAWRLENLLSREDSQLIKDHRLKDPCKQVRHHFLSTYERPPRPPALHTAMGKHSR
ncbi:MAG: hypothetical protein ACPGSC_15540, partial [Granulosicoccaceae bacterium]